jgi:hypothetical protein
MRDEPTGMKFFNWAHLYYYNAHIVQTAESL